MAYTYENYDVAVIGAGHAGCEAALACARLGLKTIVFTVSVESIALMPCNPNIGGSSKGHLVREIDALGGQMGKTADQTAAQRARRHPPPSALPEPGHRRPQRAADRTGCRQLGGCRAVLYGSFPGFPDPLVPLRSPALYAGV